MYITATQKLPISGMHRLVLLLEAKNYADDMFLAPFFTESEWELSCPIPYGRRFVAVIPGDNEGFGMVYKDSDFPKERLKRFLERHGIQ